MEIIQPVESIKKNVSVWYSAPISYFLKIGYDWIDKNITDKAFPPETAEGKSGCVKSIIPGYGELDLEFVCFDREMRMEEVQELMEKMDYRGATFREVLAFMRLWSDFLKNHSPIIVMGSTWTNPTGEKYLPSFTGDGCQKLLGLYWTSRVFHEGCWYAVVKKHKPISRQ